MGAFLDENLNFKEHNYQPKKKKCCKLWIKRFRKYVTKEATEILVLSLHALVISHLDYCNVILSGIAQGEMNKMQRIQNLCAKIGENMTVLLYNSPYRSSLSTDQMQNII